METCTFCCCFCFIFVFLQCTGLRFCFVFFVCLFFSFRLYRPFSDGNVHFFGFLVCLFFLFFFLFFSFRVYWLAESGDVSVVETCTVDGGDRYSAALFGNIQPQDLEVVHGLLMLAVPEGGGLVMHDVTTNVTRRLWSGDVYGVCLFFPDVQNPGWLFWFCGCVRGL